MLIKYLNYIFANTMAYCLGILTSFVLNRIYNFKIKDKAIKRFSRFFYRDLYEFFKYKNFFLYRMSPNKLIKIDEYNEKDEYFTFTNFIAINNKQAFITANAQNKRKTK